MLLLNPSLSLRVNCKVKIARRKESDVSVPGFHLSIIACQLIGMVSWAMPSLSVISVIHPSAAYVK
jgi:hypothetical protein